LKISPQKWENSNQKSLGSVSIEVQVLVEALIFKKAKEHHLIADLLFLAFLKMA